MQSRFALILMSVAGAGLLFCVGLVFGLGVMSSPKGGGHKEIAVTNEPVKVARRETTGSAAGTGHDLTPLTPVHPGTAAPAQTAQTPQTQPSAQPAPATAAPAPAAQTAPQPTPPAPTAQALAQPAPPPPAQAAAAAPPKPVEPATKEARATPAAAPAPEPAKPAAVEKPAAAEKPAAPANATPVALHAKNSCDVQACSRAYKSFRESDCTYQPYSGPRQLCVSPPAPTKEAARGDEQNVPVRVRRGDRDIEIQNVSRERVSDSARNRDDDGPILRRQFRRDATADGEDDGIDDSRVIVRRGDDDRSYDRGGWHRSFFAPVEDDDDDQ